MTSRGAGTNGKPASAARFAAIFGSAMTAGLVGQVLWLVTGSRVLSPAEFGAVLAAQAAYGVLQVLVDTGSGFFGARAAAAGSLDDAGRGSIFRLRVLASVAGGAVLVLVGAAGGGDSLLAAAPFAVALFLFALLRHWEPFGLGDSRPWSAYLVLRSAIPAGLAGVFLAADASFPLVLAGIGECAAILAVALGFRLRPLRGLRQAVSARSAPWRSVLLIGLPAILGQVALASGTVLLNVFGAATAAAAFAVSVRLLTGLNHLSGIIPTALFPRLAAAADESDGASRSSAGRIGVGVLAALGSIAAANAALLVAPSFFVSILLDRTDTDAERTAILVVGSASATSLLVLGSLVLTARGFESTFVRVYGVSTAVVVLGGLAVVAFEPASEASAMASVFAVGQVLAVALLARAAHVAVRELAGPLKRGAAVAAAIVGVSFVTAFVPGVRPLLAVGFGVVAAVALLAAVGRVRTQPTPAQAQHTDPTGDVPKDRSAVPRH